jgi:hypothetical protein
MFMVICITLIYKVLLYFLHFSEFKTMNLLYERQNNETNPIFTKSNVHRNRSKIIITRDNLLVQ